MNLYDSFNRSTKDINIIKEYKSYYIKLYKLREIFYEKQKKIKINKYCDNLDSQWVDIIAKEYILNAFSKAIGFEKGKHVIDKAGNIYKVNFIRGDLSADLDTFAVTLFNVRTQINHDVYPRYRRKSLTYHLTEENYIDNYERLDIKKYIL